MSGAHTEGPWECEKGAGRGAWIKGRSGEWAALACGGNDATARANARVIAASPCLLVAAILAEDIIDDFLCHLSPDEQIACAEDPKASAALKALRAAICKATTAVEPNSVGTPQGVNQK